MAKCGGLHALICAVMLEIGPTATLKHERFLLLNTKSVLKGSLNSPSWLENGPGVKCRIFCQTGALEILENSPVAGV